MKSVKCLPEHKHKGTQVAMDDLPSSENSSRLREPVAHIENLAPIHIRYQKVLKFMNANKYISLANALSRLKIGKNTLRDTLPIAELRIVNMMQYQNMLKEARRRAKGKNVTNN
jgi:hypothetical protein